MKEDRLRDNLLKVQATLPQNVRLVAVSKYHSIEEIQALYNAGQRCFGESRAQELLVKYEALPKDIEWHFIGNLQSNKVKQIVPIVTTIHSVNSPTLLKEIEKQAAKHQRTIRCLLEAHVAQEESKQGMSVADCETLGSQPWIATLKYARVCGVMGMASFTEDRQQIRNEFRALRSLFDRLCTSAFKDAPDFKDVSMGMSGDYLIAIEEGSTMVRVGSILFE